MNELTFHQNVYRNKDGQLIVYASIHESVEAAKKAATNQKKSDVYVGTILHRGTNLLK